MSDNLSPLTCFPREVRQAWTDYTEGRLRIVDSSEGWRKARLSTVCCIWNEAFAVIIKEHLQLVHSGRDKTWAAVNAKYYGIQKTDVVWVCAHCKNCILNRPSTSKPPLEPIVADETFVRLQIDLIDLWHEPPAFSTHGRARVILMKRCSPCKI